MSFCSMLFILYVHPQKAKLNNDYVLCKVNKNTIIIESRPGGYMGAHLYIK